ncbi:MAG: class I SAM-dependent methyltransferase [Planctomycetota bacterium]
MNLDPTRRFSNRVENYLQYRPRYPQEILPFLAKEIHFSPEALVADIGSGTGFLTELLLQYGNSVFAVEPNLEMRSAAEKLLQEDPHFHSINGSAESTTLADHKIDFIFAAQAFHWFDWTHAKKEFQRILKPNGWVVLIWNDRNQQQSPLMQAYDQLLYRYGVDYEKVQQRYADKKVLESFFEPSGFRYTSFPYFQTFDYQGFQGRLLSSSYAPLEGPNYEKMIQGLHSIFEQFQVNQQIRFDYQTQVYYGSIS